MSKEQQAAGAPPPYAGDSPYPPPTNAYPPPTNAYPPPTNAYPPPANAYPPQYGGPGQPQAPLQSHYYAWPGYPNQPGYGQPYMANQTGYSQGTTVVVAQPAVTVIQVFRDTPVHTNCPNCRAEIVTAIQYETGTFAWVICCVLWFVGCGLGCCLIPFCLDGCKDVIHTCPNCNQHLARFSRM